MIGPILLHRRARRAEGIVVLHLLPGSVVEMPDGRRLRVQPRGELDRVVEGGRPHGGIAEDPAAGRTP